MERAAARTALSRRDFVQGVGALALGLAAGCGRLPGQAPARAPRVGYLTLGVAGDAADTQFEIFRQGLREYGYVEGQDIAVEYRTASLRDERLPDLAADLVGLPVTLIVAVSTPANFAAARSTATLPVVTVLGNPVRDGLADSYARPGRNVTGLVRLSSQYVGKQLELLTESVPGASRFAVVWNGANASKADEFSALQAAAQPMGVHVQSLTVTGSDDVDGAVATAIRERADALITLSDPLTNAHGRRIAELAARSKLPTMFEPRERVVDGGLMAYGSSATYHFRRAAYFVDRILKGAQPADLPIETPREFDFIINLKTAQALGLTIPQSVLLQATEVIQ